MPASIVPPRPNRLLAAVHLRLARLVDLPEVACFCDQYRTTEIASGRTTSELSALLHGHVDTVIVALREHTLLGVALCGVTRGRARLIELAVQPGAEKACIERRLLRRSMGNLQALGVRSLDFTAPARGPARAAPLPPPAATAHVYDAAASTGNSPVAQTAQA